MRLVLPNLLSTIEPFSNSTGAVICERKELKNLLILNSSKVASVTPVQTTLSRMAPLLQQIHDNVRVVKDHDALIPRNRDCSFSQFTMPLTLSIYRCSSPNPSQKKE